MALLRKSPSNGHNPQVPLRILVFVAAPTIGDAAIGVAILDELQRLEADVQIRLMTLTPDKISAIPEFSEFEVVEPVALKPRTAKFWLWRPLRFWFRYIFIRYRYLHWVLPKRLRADIQQAFETSDIIVFQGGPSWNDEWLSVGGLKDRLLQFALFRSLGLPIVLYAQSFGPFSWPGWKGRYMKILAKWTLNKAHLITVRDAFSLAAVRRLGVSTAVVRAADVAILLRACEGKEGRRILEENGVSKDRPLVGFCVRSLRSEYGYSPDVEAKLQVGLVELLDRIAATLGQVVFLSMDFDRHSHRDNDFDVARKLISRMRHGENVKLLDVALSPREFKAVCRELDVLISMRLHPIILATSEGKPCISIAYSAKCDDFMQMAGVPESCFSLPLFRADDVINRLRYLLKDYAKQCENVQRNLQAVRQAAGRSRVSFRDMFVNSS